MTVISRRDFLRWIGFGIISCMCLPFFGKAVFNKPQKKIMHMGKYYNKLAG